MNKLYTAICTILILLCFADKSYAQQVLVNDTGKKALIGLSAKSHSNFIISYKKALALAKKMAGPLNGKRGTAELYRCRG